MDMPLPQGTGVTPDDGPHPTLARLAQVLGCSPDRFFEPPNSGYPKYTSQLIQIWLAIRSSEGRDAVYAFANEVLRSEK